MILIYIITQPCVSSQVIVDVRSWFMELHIVAYETKNIVHGSISCFEECNRHCRVLNCM